ncbi:uncharacterized protein LOC144139776 [Haemaphysalis longicornis]
MTNPRDPTLRRTWFSWPIPLSGHRTTVPRAFAEAVAMQCPLQLAALLSLLLLLPGQGQAEAARRVVRYRCQYLHAHNRTKLVCGPAEKASVQDPPPKAAADTDPETFNGQTYKAGACGRLQKLAERLAPFENGAWKYCDPSSCLRESPHCASNVLGAECSRCLGRCWIMYTYPEAGTTSGAKEFPCDPLGCGGPDLFCGGYKYKDGP